MKINKKRGFALVAAAATATLLSVGVAPAQAATVVTIWMGQGTKDTVGKALEAFDKADPSLTINIVIKEMGVIGSAAITAIPRGTGPDILAGPYDLTGKLLGAGVISPISLGANGKNFSAATKSGYTVYGKLYGVPAWTENIALMYNKKKVSKPVTTGAQFAAAIAAGKVALSHDLTGQGDPYHMTAFSSSFGIDQYLRVGGTWTTTVGFTDANSKGGLTKYANWLNGAGKGLKYVGWTGAAASFQDPNSNVAYWLTGPWGAGEVTSNTHSYGTPAVTTAKLTAKDIGIASIPSIGGKTVHQFSGGHGYWQSVKVPGSSKARSVGKVLAALAGKTIQFASFKTTGKTPANAAALAKVSDPLVKGFGAAGKNAYPMPAFVFQGTTWTKIGSAEVAILKGALDGKTPAQYMSDAVASLQEIIDGA